MVAVYMAFASILSVLATGRYEMAMNLPAKNEDAASILAVSLKLCVLFSSLLYIPIYIWNTDIARFLGHQELGAWLYLLPLSVLATGTFSTYQFWCNRKSAYHQMSMNQIQMSGGMAFLNVGLGFLKVNNGMLIGSIGGQILSSAIVAARQWHVNRELHRQSTLHAQLALAKAYRKHPLHVAPAHMIGVGAQQLPLVMISSAFSASAGGFFSLAYRVINLPAGIIANAIGEVFRQQASEEYIARKDFRKLYISVLKKTSLTAPIPFLALYFLLPDIFRIVFGQEWQIAASYAQILLVPSFFMFVITPIDKVFLIYQKTSYEFAIQTLRAILLGALFLLAVSGKFSIETILTLFSVSMSIVYLTVLWLSSRLVFSKTS